jgi:hypothetical protein
VRLGLRCGNLEGGVRGRNGAMVPVVVVSVKDAMLVLEAMLLVMFVVLMFVIDVLVGKTLVELLVLAKEI